MRLSDLGEKEIIRRLIRPAGPPRPGLLALNDDAQILRPPDDSGNPMVITTDRTPSDLRPLVWGIFDLAEYGRYSAMSNISDVAAMGAAPFGYLLNIGARSDMELAHFECVLGGVMSELRSHGVDLLGGDTKEADALSLVGVAVGQSRSPRVLSRSGARIGDILVVNREPIGGVPAAHAYFRRFGPARESALASDLADCFHGLSARVAEAALLQDSGVCTSCIDNSDGIAACLDEIGSASGVGFVLDLRVIDVHSRARDAAQRLGQSPLSLAMGAGGDFRLVATVSAWTPTLEHSFVRIGTVCDVADQSFELSGASRWNHFSI